ncbi:MAG: 4Fe-4S dicluster domain-containing protein [Deltaproteobacteria bacterium]|nr:4Fe-4S dicluster domain-containing protein [Deltaproteobacteria bacterium]
MEADVRYEADLDPGFLDEIASLPEGERIRHCIQCGNCSGMCPVAPMLEHSPRRIFAMIRAGLKDEVLRSLTPWVCSSCYRCTVKCPADIKITDIMYALKRRAIASGTLPEDSDAHRFARLFTEGVCKNGRTHEMGLLMRYMAFHHPIAMMKQSGLGMRMMAKGRMPLFAHKISDRDHFRKMVEKALSFDEMEPGSSEGGAL